MPDLIAAPVAWARGRRPRRADLKADVLAGLPGAISNVPDGMAASLLAGVNPVHGLYACFAGPVAGGLTSSSRLMVVVTTSAAALAAGSALQSTPTNDRAAAVVWLTLVAGTLMVLAGVFHLGRYTRFVSQSVMLGFLSGIAVNIVLSQIPSLTGAPSQGSVAIEKAWNVLTNPSEMNLASCLAGFGALLILVVVSRTPLSLFASLVALIVPTALVLIAGADSVAQVKDVGEIPTGIPLPAFPTLSALSIHVVVGAASVAAIVLVQGAGVAEIAPNPDGSRGRSNTDFMAQGFGNLASGVFGGQPVGGSLGQTALNVTAGARSRWAGIFSGFWMLLILVAFSGLVAKVVMPTLAAVLIYAGVGALRVGQVETVARTSMTSRVALVTTFVATLFLPVAAAVGIGVALSLMLQLNQEALDLSVKRLVPTDDGHLLETEAPKFLQPGDIVALDVYGSLFYAGARTLQARLPDPTGADGAVVVLRLRGRTTLGSTALTVLADYARSLDAVHGSLYLTGLDETLVSQWERLGLGEEYENIHIYPAGPVLGGSTYAALLDARAHQIRADPADLS